MEIISNNKTGVNTVETEFKINAEDFETAVQAAFLKKRANITVPGFRKGKATRKMVETAYGEGVFYEDAVNELYRKYMPELVDELKLDIVDAPEVKISSLSKDDGVVFAVTFTVKPEVNVGEYKGLEVEVEVGEVTEDDIDDYIEKIRLDNARIIDITDRPVIKGDTIKFDFDGFHEGKMFEGGSAKGFSLEVGSGRFIPGFEDQIIGKKIGEDFDVDVTFPADYTAVDLAGKDAVFKCRISEISGKETTEFDDEFVKDISEFDTVSEYREDVRRKLGESKESLRDINLEHALAERIVNEMQAEIPEAMFEYRIDEMVRDWSYRYNMSAEDYIKRAGLNEEAFRNNFRDVAQKQVKFRLALEKIADLEQIEVNKEEIDAEYKRMAESFRMNESKVRTNISEQAVTEDVKTEKALKMIKETAIVKEIPATAKEEQQ